MELYTYTAAVTTTGKATFTDLTQDWYIKAVMWANANGIVLGKSETSYAPNDPITREQMAAIMYRYCNFKGYDTSNSALVEDYPDADQISGYAMEAVSWAVGDGLITGTENNGVVVLDPRGNATRAQIATILMRFMQNIVAE